MSRLAAPELTEKQSAQEFDRLFREHSRLVYRTAYALIGDAEDAEDVLQTVFLRLVRRRLPPDLRDNPKPYLYRAAVNASLSVIRSRRRRIQAEAETVESSVHTARVSEAEEVRDHFLTMLDTLAESDPGSVELLILRYVHNYSDTDIAKMFGKSRSAIAVRLFRARARLKKLMRRSGENK
jgi:RNA polymerase sigma-70 factor (ECF subfamily)